MISLAVISSCTKHDNYTMPDGIEYINQPQIEKMAGGDPAILDTDPLGFKSKVSVDLYFKNSKKPDYLDLVVVKNGDAKNAKVLKAQIKDYPTEVEITGSLLTELFGAAIVSGDQFDVGADYITGGKTYKAFPEVGEAYGSGVSSQPGASPTARFGAICGFEADDYVGDFNVVVDGWDDFGVGSTAEVTKVDENTLAITYPVPGFKPIIVKINTGDNTLKVDQQEVGDFGDWGYGVFSVYSVAGNDNFVDPCTGKLSVRLQYIVSAGTFGNFLLVLEK